MNLNDVKAYLEQHAQSVNWEAIAKRHEAAQKRIQAKKLTEEARI